MVGQVVTDTIVVIAGDTQDTYMIDVLLGGLESMLTFGAERLVVVTRVEAVRAVADARHRCEVVRSAPYRPHMLIIFGKGEQKMADKAAMKDIPFYRITRWGVLDA